MITNVSKIKTFKESSIRLDIEILMVSLVILAFGLLSVYSASHASKNVAIFYKQIAWVVIGSICCLAAYFAPYKVFYRWAYYIYVISILLLILVLFFGKRIGGAMSWFNLGFLSLQPSEMGKIGTILAICRYVSRPEFSPRSGFQNLLASLIIAIPILLILFQPDTGTAMTYMPCLLPVLLIAGLDFYLLALMLIPIALSAIGFFNIYIALALCAVIYIPLIILRKNSIITIISLVTSMMFSTVSNVFIKDILKPHQVKRIKTFLDPSLDARGVGYNATQSKIAIGSGGLWGKGFLNGTQTQLRFIPAQSTDFIFCIIGEEFGFVGTFGLLMLFLRILYLKISLVFRAKSVFARSLVAAIATIFLAHITINTGMAVGLLPVVGIPLPLVSYGGSAMLVNLTLIGIVANIAKNIRNLPLA